MEDVFRATLLGVEVAVTLTRNSWRQQTGDMAGYRQEVEAMSQFAGAAAFANLLRLDFRHVPKSLRTRLVNNLENFENLKVLNLTSGQSMLKSVSARIVAGMTSLRKLTHFFCKHDCTSELLVALASVSGVSMKVLDVENSKAVDDSCVVPILEMTGLEELNVFSTRLGDEAKARLLMGLPLLVRLVRGDFLCDALGWIDYLDEWPSEATLLLTEFFPSQSYYFHEEWQMEMVARRCPFISRMFFIFHETCVPNLMVLSAFENLTELCLYGGHFYKDKLRDLLEVRGCNLRELSLICVRNVDYLASALISQYCPRLKVLALSNCDLGEFRLSNNDDPNSDENYERRQAFIRMARNAQATIVDFAELTELSLYSRCRSTYLVFLLGHCPNLETLRLGTGCDMNDEVLNRILIPDRRMSQLREFHCEAAGAGMTMRSVHLLTITCSELEVLGDLQAWSGVTPAEVGAFRQSCFQANWLLDTSSHQRLRKYLEMPDYDRRTYVNLMAGPNIERIRRAERARNAQLENQET